MRTRSSVIRQRNRRQYQDETEYNHKNVHFLDMKLYDPLVLTVTMLDPSSISKLARTCSTMFEKVKRMRGVRVPFDMGTLEYTMNAGTMQRKLLKNDGSKWNNWIAASVQRSMPLLQPFVMCIDMHYAPLTEKLLKNVKHCLSKIKANKVNEMEITDVVGNNAWDGLKTLITTYGIEDVFLRGEFPEEHQLSPFFLNMPGLHYSRVWSEEYIKNTSRRSFNFSIVTFERLMTVLKRWHSEDFLKWIGRTFDMDIVNKCKDRYPNVTPGQRTRYPKERPLLCELKRKMRNRSLAILRQDGKVVFVDFLYIFGFRYDMYIYFAEESAYPPSFKKILGA